MITWCIVRTLKSLHYRCLLRITNTHGYNLHRSNDLLVLLTRSFNKSTVPCANVSSTYRTFPIKAWVLNYWNKSLLDRSNVKSKIHHANRLANFTYIDKVFESFYNSKQSVTPLKLATAFRTLDTLVTKQINLFPWAIKDDDMLQYLQSFHHKESRDVYNYIRRCLEFDDMCHLAKGNADKFSNNDLLTTTFIVMKLAALNTENECFKTLLKECQRRQEEFELDNLTIYSSIAKLMRKNGSNISKYISDKLQRLWPQSKDISENDFINLIKILYNIELYVTEDTVKKFETSLHEWTKYHLDAVDSDSILKLTETLTRYSVHCKTETITMSIQHLEERIDSLSTWQLCRLAMFLRTINYYSASLQNKISRHVDQLVHDKKLSMIDVVSLAFINNYVKCSDSSYKIIEDLLPLYLEKLDFALMRYLMMMSVLTSPKQANAFYQRLWNQRNEFNSSVSCLLGIINCLSTMQDGLLDPKLDSSFPQELSQFLMETKLINHPKHVLTISRYLMKYLHLLDAKALAALHKKIINVLPQLSVFDIIYLGSVLPSKYSQKSGYSLTALNCQNYSHLLVKILFKESMHRLHELKNMHDVNLLAKSILVKVNHKLFQRYTPQIVAIYKYHLPGLKNHSIKDTVKLLKALQLNLTDCFECFASRISKKPSSFTLRELTYTLDLFASFNYHSVSLDRLSAIVINKIKNLEVWQVQLDTILMATNALASFQIYPEELLRRVFSLDFLTQFDATIDDSSNELGSRLKKLLVKLNRSVILQCPHLIVPWICNSSTSTTSDDESYQVVSSISVINRELINVLGGQEFVKFGPIITSYGHRYDLECHFDINQKPVPIDSPEVHFKLAVLLLTPKHFSLNDNILLDSARNLVTQLEILGLTVIQVPYFKLNSLRIGERNTRQKYFENLLFNDPISALIADMKT